MMEMCLKADNMKMIELPNNTELKAKYSNLPLLEFNKLYVLPEDFLCSRKPTAVNSSFQN